ncbi:MAG: F0F1 ATP synthase subunit B [Lactobacillus sp.]|nr:F0F1 ATP synthase subunit B [Lactobacillus sp.]MDN6043109.1 F0F1 ATP synthase subunit B [Lactobacillus sp.]MDN6052369.1 F0F1 ATP synthase subunit B [Lactobacillus sp.]
MTFQLLFAATAGKLYIGNEIWYLICFAILLIVVKRYAWGPVSEMLAKRQQRIVEDLDTAAENRKKAETLANEREAALKRSRQEAMKVLSDANATAQRMSETIVSEANNQASTIRQQAKADATQAKVDALSSARDEVADISVAIAEKVIAKNLSADDQKALVDQFIKGLSD